MPSVIQNDIATAMRELQTAGGPNGVAEKIQIGNQSSDAFVSDIPNDEQLVPGGEAETGKFTAWILKTDFNGKPEEGTECRVRGEDLQLINPITDRVSYWEITIGDYANE